MPPIADVRLVSGTPMTGRSVCAATTPGSAADRPAPAMITRMPRICAFLAYVGDRVGLAVGGHHADLVQDAAGLQLVGGLLHLVHVATWSP